MKPALILVEVKVGPLLFLEPNGDKAVPTKLFWPMWPYCQALNCELVMDPNIEQELYPHHSYALSHLQGSFHCSWAAVAMAQGHIRSGIRPTSEYGELTSIKSCLQKNRHGNHITRGVHHPCAILISFFANFAIICRSLNFPLAHQNW